MNAAAFRRLALSLPGAIESSHMAHPDFRVGNKIFATLGYPNPKHGMLKLTPEQQAELLRAAPKTFGPAAGAWGRNGSTVVLLASVKATTLGALLRQAWANASAPPVRKRRRPR